MAIIIKNQLVHHKRMVPMRSLFLFSLVSMLSRTVLSAPGLADGRRTDHSALLEMKAKIVDPDGALSAWNDTTSFCRWPGVTCGHKHQRVTMLDLRSLTLSGIISPHIGNLSFLRRIQFQNNSFYSTIPSEIGNLQRLRELYLNNNSFSGEIPSNLSQCSNLELINVGRNSLEGNLPAEIGSMPRLQVLILQVNNLTGHVPPSIGNLSSLQAFSITLNSFEGRIPETLGYLKNLTILYVNVNKFSGDIPRLIFNITSLRELEVAENQFEGTLPSDLGITLPNIETIGMSDNMLGGSIPNSLSNASNLVSVEIILNNFRGDVPSLAKLTRLQWFNIGQNQLGAGKSDDLRFLCSLTDSTSLEILGIDDNNFGGAIPECIGNLPVTLQQLAISYNKISGVLPTSIGNLVNLEVLVAWENNIQGEIPASIGNLRRLSTLNLYLNDISGQIPPSLGDLEMLTDLQLYGNKLHGPIPSTLGNCKNLLLMDLSENNLSGPIPPEILALSSLSVALVLYQNNLTGPLPVEVGSLINLSVLRLNGNRLSRGIPSSISSCMEMEELYLQDNFFEGPIPTSLSSSRGLRILNFSNNGMSGPIPQFLQFMNLTNLSLSYNDFEGALPTGGIFSNVNATTVAGNKKLCGGLPEFHLPACNIKRSNKKGLSTKIKILISISSGLIPIIFIILAFFALVFRQKKREEHSSTIEEGFPNVSYHGLSKATNGFSPENVIGSGSFGTVYRGLLDQSQQTVAIKVLNLGRYGASKSFISECEALRRIRHRNLVKVLTACSGIDHQGNDFKALVYEFMSNGNLDQWLHPSSSDNRNNHGELDAVKRLNIVIDVACALDYLHHQCETPIVHCDLKPSNVLLDEEMTGHLSDFGLARFLPETTHKLLTAQTSSIGVKGSFGYIAPEYATGSDISTQGDTYSFGVLILEMFTGRRPTDDLFQDSLNLHVFAKEALPNHVLDIIDPRLLQGQDERESMNNENPRRSRWDEHSLKVQECLTSLIEIGVACSSDIARERMDIGDVANALQATKDKLLRRSKKGHPPI